MKVSLSWLDDACGGRVDRASLLRWLREAGSSAALSGERALDVDVSAAFPHLGSVRGLATELAGRAGRASPLTHSASPGTLPEGAGLGIGVDEGLTARVAAVRLALPGPFRVPEREASWLRDSGVRTTGTVADLLAYVELERGVPLASLDPSAAGPDGLRLGTAAGDEVLDDGGGTDGTGGTGEAGGEGAGDEGGPEGVPAGSWVLTGGGRVLAVPGTGVVPGAGAVPGTAAVPGTGAGGRGVRGSVPGTGAAGEGAGEDAGAELLLCTWWLSAPRADRSVSGHPGEHAAGLCDTVVARAAELAADWAGATVVASGAAGLAPPERTLTVPADTLRRHLDDADALPGTGPGSAPGSAPARDAPRPLTLLRAVGLTAEETAGGRLRIGVPPERPDLDRVELIAAEAARMRGYRAVPTRIPPPTVSLPVADADAVLRDNVRTAALRSGLQQVMTPVLYPASSPQADLDFPYDRDHGHPHGTQGSTRDGTPRPPAPGAPTADGGTTGDGGTGGDVGPGGDGATGGDVGYPSPPGAPGAPIEVRGRAGLRHLRVRTSLLPGVLEAAARSLQHTGAAHHFETAPVTRSTTPGDERWHFAAVLGGHTAPPSLVEPEPRRTVFGDLDAMVRTVGRATGRGPGELVPGPHPLLDPAASFTLRYSGHAVGRAGLVAADVCARLDAPEGVRLFCVDIDLAAMGAAPAVRGEVHVPPRVPLPAFNVTVVVPEATSAADVVRVVADAGRTPRHLVQVKDMLQGEQLGEGLISMTVRAAFAEGTGQGIKAQRRERRGLALDAIHRQGWQGH